MNRRSIQWEQRFFEQHSPVRLNHRLTSSFKRIESNAWIFVLLIATAMRWFALDTVPPGIKYDTTSSGVYALNVVFHNTRPFYINPSGAPEPLMVYLQAFAIYLFGVNAFTLRFLSALVGILVVAFLYALAKKMTGDRRLALVTTFALAVAIEPINVTRTGLRATLVPFFETAWLLWFWRGWREGRQRDFVIAGILLGLCMYTYLAALAIPLIAAGWWAHQFIFARKRWQARLVPILVMGMVMVLLLVPRLIFHLSYPTTGLKRISEVSILQNPAIETYGLGYVIIARLIDYAQMFGIAWQGELYNVLHQPLLDPFLFGCFLVGLAVCLTRLRQIEWAWAPLTLVVMLLPDLLGANEPSPNELRTIGIIPPTYFLVGVGAASLLDFARRHARLRRWVPAAIVVALGAGTLIGWQAYFGDFASAAQTGPDEDYNRTEIAQAQWINQSDAVFLPLNEYARSPVHYLTGAHAPYLQSAMDADGSLNQVLLGPAWVLLPLDHTRPRTEGRDYVHDPASFVLIKQNRVWILPPAQASPETLLRDRAPNQEIRDSLGNIVANAYLIDDPSLFQFKLPPSPSSSAHFSQGITLVAWALDNARVEPGTSVGISLFWSTPRRLSDDYVIFAHVLDFEGNLLSGTDVIPGLGAYPTYLWKPGEIVSTHHELKIPAPTAAGKYTIEVGMYNVLNDNRLDVLDAKGQPVDSRVIVGTFKVVPTQPASYTPSHTQHAEFNHAIALLGFDAPAQVNAGDETRLTLYWHSLSALRNDYTVFVHLLDANGNVVAYADHQPQAGLYPTSIWDPDEQVLDDAQFFIPPDLPAGPYRIEIGWYDLNSGKRLTLQDGTDRVILDTVLSIGK